jgi:hypothetical protein
VPHTDLTPLEEAERRLAMNLSLIAMLKKNTTDEQIAKLRKLWVEPVEEQIRSLLLSDTDIR